ncbi:MAG: Ppx/GppA family phosphatase [Eubacteriaceae bacterium]|jgi:exopolyphosphatase/guanosine-5'-triphosphate,3'-diphosphate pyrophosphatase
MDNEKKRKANNYAVIDFGSNSIRMLIFRRDKKGNLFQVNRSLRYTRLGQHVGKSGMICDDAMSRNLEAADEFAGIARDYDVREIYAFGTSALRDAANSRQFLDLIKERTGIEIDILSGEQEAQYGFIGVSQCFKGSVLVFDIGGGSTELIYGKTEINDMISLNLGCVRSTEDYLHQDPPKKEELDALFDHAYDTIHTALSGFHFNQEEYKLVGIGGTVTSLATIDQQLLIYDSTKVHNSVITEKELDDMIANLASRNLEERQTIPGLEAKRADIILAGAIIVKAVLKATGRDAFTVCDYDNMEGAAWTRYISQGR